MGIFYTEGEKKDRAGTYNRYENNGGVPVAGVTDGIVATVFGGNWGPLNEVKAIGFSEDPSLIYGNTGDTIIERVFSGGATQVLGVRIGTGGAKGSIVLKDTTATPVDAITATLKYEGNRALGFVVRDVLGDAGSKEFLVTEGGTVLEKITFPVSAAGEVDALIVAFASSAYVTMVKKLAYAGTGKVALVASGTFAGGTNPVITNESYSTGFGLLEGKKWGYVVVDTNEVTVHTILSGFVNRMYQLGKMGFAVVGEPSSVAFDTRCINAKAYNDYNTIYVGGGYINQLGIKIEGWEAAAYFAGLVASTPSSKSVTHKVVVGAVSPAETMLDSQYKKAIKSGMVTFSTSASGSVWVESGITTLTTPTGEDDNGWQKIKRVKIRFEMMTRISDTLDKLIGDVNGDPDGKAYVVEVGQGVLNVIVQEGGKVATGAKFELVDTPQADADSVYYQIIGDDIDSLEKFYLLYKFRFSATA